MSNKQGVSIRPKNIFTQTAYGFALSVVTNQRL